MAAHSLALAAAALWAAVVVGAAPPGAPDYEKYMDGYSGDMTGANFAGDGEKANGVDEAGVGYEKYMSGYQQYMNGGENYPVDRVSNPESYMHDYAQGGGGGDYEKYMHLKRYMQGGRQAGYEKYVPGSAANCRTEAELNTWWQEQVEQMRYVPEAWRKAPLERQRKEYDKYLARIRSRESAQEGASEETRHEAPKEAATEAPNEATKEAAKEAPKEVATEAPKEAAKEAPKEAPKEAAKEAPKEAENEEQASLEEKQPRSRDGRAPEAKRAADEPRAEHKAEEAAVAKTPDEAAVEFLVDPSEREVWRVPFVGAACLAVVASAAALVVASARRGDSHLEAPFLHMAGEV